MSCAVRSRRYGALIRQTFLLSLRASPAEGGHSWASLRHLSTSQLPLATFSIPNLESAQSCETSCEPGCSADSYKLNSSLHHLLLDLQLPHSGFSRLSPSALRTGPATSLCFHSPSSEGPCLHKLPPSTAFNRYSRSFSTFAHSALASAPSSSSPPSSASPRFVPPGGFLVLNTLRDKPGSRKAKIRLGRGIGSGKGKTSGRGHKGQKARSGRNPRIGYEGGQTPLRLTIPRRGFHNPDKLEFQEVNVETINRKIQEGKINPQELITMKTLKDAGAVGKALRDGMKLLGRGAKNLSVPLHIEVSRVSERAKQAVEAAGGSVTRVHYNKLALRALLKPEWFAQKGRLIPKSARPPPRLLGQVDAIGRLPAPTTPMPRPTEAPAA